MQSCDATCSHCARHFWAWWKSRSHQMGRNYDGRSGPGNFDLEAVTSREKSSGEAKRLTD